MRGRPWLLVLGVVLATFAVTGAIQWSGGMLREETVISADSDPVSPEVDAALFARLEARACELSEHDEVELGLLPDTEGDGITWEFRDSLTRDTYWVDVETEQMQYYSNSAGYEPPVGSRVSTEQIEVAASEYAWRVYNQDRLPNMERTIEFVDHGDLCEYAVRYDERIDGVTTGNFLHIDYREDGVLLTCSLEDVDVEIDLRHEVTRDEAIATAAEHFGLDEWRSVDAELSVAQGYQIEDFLAWNVSFEIEIPPNAMGAGDRWVTLDAVSGEVVDEAVSAGLQ
jgi:hypothetical protein